MVDKEKLDKFLKTFDTEFTDWEKDILIRMIENPNSHYVCCFPRGMGYSIARSLSDACRKFLDMTDKVKTISEINDEIKNGAKLSSTLGGRPIPLPLDKRIENINRRTK